MVMTYTEFLLTWGGAFLMFLICAGVFYLFGWLADRGYQKTLVVYGLALCAFMLAMCEATP